MSSPLITVDLEWEHGVHFIVGHKTGVAYEHQCGGLGCQQRSLEGFLVPWIQPEWAEGVAITDALYHHFNEGPKYRGGCHSGLDKEDADLIDGLLHSTGFSPLTVDRKKLHESVEAWVYLQVSAEYPGFPWCRGHTVDPTSLIVMIWENSD